MAESLHVKYRPDEFEKIIGQETIIGSLQQTLEAGDQHAFLFTGPSGCGKTTIARIISDLYECQLQEVDAATHTGIDAMKEVTQTLKYTAFGAKANKAILIDECFHRETLVNTGYGKKPIGSFKIGDTVLNKEGISKVSNVFVNKVPVERIAKMKLSNGDTIVCSKDHEFLTETGWLKAYEIRQGVLFYSPKHGVSNNSLQWNQHLQTVRGTVQPESLERFPMQELQVQNNNLSCVQKKIPSTTRKIPQTSGNVEDRQKEVGSFGKVWMESVEVYQRGSEFSTFKNIIDNKDLCRGFVEFYDLEVIGHHSYFISKNKISSEVLVHNCHALSKSAWQSLLKIIEEPPEHVYFILCTTEPTKVPTTIKTRCVCHNLVPLTVEEILGILVEINYQEDLGTSEKVLSMIAKESEGSPRMAITNLEKCRGMEDRDDAYDLLEVVEASKEVIDLCRWIASGKNFNWKNVQKHIEPIKDSNPESIRIVVNNYFNSILLKAEKDNQIQWALAVLSAFSEPCNPSDKMAPIYLSIGGLIYGED